MREAGAFMRLAPQGGRSRCRIVGHPAGCGSHARQRLHRACDALLHTLEQPVARRVVRTHERLLEGVGIGRAVALEDEAAQAQQRRAVVAPVIHAGLEAVEYRQGHEARQPAVERALELALDELAQHRGQALGALEHHVAHEAIAHHDVGGALEDVVALHVAVEADEAGGRGLAHELARALDRLAALDRFLADVEQPHARLGHAVHGAHERAAQHRKLQQVFGRAVHVGAQVEHGGVAILAVGQDGGDGRAVDALDGLEQVARQRHQRARVARRHAHVRGRLGLRIGRLHLGDRHAHGGIALLAQCHLHRVVHRHHFRGGHHLAARPATRGSQRIGLAHQQQFGLGMRIEEGAAGRQRHGRAVVAAHAVHRQPHPAQRLRRHGAPSEMIRVRMRGRRRRGRAGKDQASAFVLSTLRPR
jgi:hypothetical protein